MKNHISFPPRKLSFWNMFILFNSVGEFRETWNALGISSLIFWFVLFRVDLGVILIIPMLFFLPILILGLLGLWLNTKLAMHTINLLKNGQIAYGEDIGMKDEVGKLVFYSARNPSDYVVYDDLENAPEILLDGHFSTIPSSKLSVLIAPIVVIMINLGFINYHSDSIMRYLNPPPEPESIQKFFARHPQSIAKYRFEASEFIREGKKDKAIDRYKKAIEFAKKTPLNMIPDVDRGQILSIYSFIDFYESDPEGRYHNAQELKEHVETIQRIFPNDSMNTANMVGLHYIMSGAALFVQSFEEAEQSALKALEMGPERSICYTHLPAALLFQGKFEKAKPLYLEWKDKKNPEQVPGHFMTFIVSTPSRPHPQTFKDLFLRDLDDLESLGITHPDVEKARALLMD